MDPSDTAVPPPREVERVAERICELSLKFEASIFRGRKGG